MLLIESVQISKKMIDEIWNTYSKWGQEVKEKDVYFCKIDFFKPQKSDSSWASFHFEMSLFQMLNLILAW